MKIENVWIVEPDLTRSPGHVTLEGDGQLPACVGFAYPGGEGFRTYTLTQLPEPLSWRGTLRLLAHERLWRRTSLPVYLRTRGVTAVCWTCRQAVGAEEDHRAADFRAREHRLDHGENHVTLLVSDELADENLVQMEDVDARTVGELREICGVKLNPSVKIPTDL